MNSLDDTIVALATPSGQGAIGIIRLSGNDAIAIADKIFKGKILAQQNTHTIHYGKIAADNLSLPLLEEGSRKEVVIDEVVVSLYRAPKSYTGEDVVEISCHGSDYILQSVISLCTANGAVMAKPGEFTQRAFLNGKLDLTQAEAVGDMIASESEAAHRAAMHNLRGGFASDLQSLREQLINFTALIELELDFSEEDVAFADRNALLNLITDAAKHIDRLIQSFKLGNAIKNGIKVAIIGKPNAGKSTLLNALLNEERAIVSDIAGTTRDTIEEAIHIRGVLFKMIDTAGIRDNSEDIIEQQGIARSKRAADEAEIIVYVIDQSDPQYQEEISSQLSWIEMMNKPFIIALNKTDKISDNNADSIALYNTIQIQANIGKGIDDLKEKLFQSGVGEDLKTEHTIITNTRHLHALQQIAISLEDVKNGLNRNIPGDLLTLDIRRALHYIGELTGAVQTDRDILGTIFGKFCIGK